MGKNPFFSCTSSKKSKRKKKKIGHKESFDEYLPSDQLLNGAETNEWLRKQDKETQCDIQPDGSVGSGREAISNGDDYFSRDSISIGLQTLLEDQIKPVIKTADFVCQVAFDNNEDISEKNIDSIDSSRSNQRLFEKESLVCEQSQKGEISKANDANITQITTDDVKQQEPNEATKKKQVSLKAKSSLWRAIKRVSSAPTEIKTEDLVDENGDLLNPEAVRAMLQNPTMKSYTTFMICLKKGSAKFIEQIIHECDAFQLMFDALTALSLKTIGNWRL